MSYEVIHGWLKASPFTPFSVVTSSGERYEIKHPEMAFITKPQLYIAMPDPDGIPSRVKMIATLHITALEPLDSNSAA
jgi:hypothetical protein